MTFLVQQALSVIANCLRQLGLGKQTLVAMLASLLHVSSPHSHKHAHASTPQTNNSSHIRPQPRISTQSKDGIDVEVTAVPSPLSPTPSIMAPIPVTTMDEFMTEVRRLFEAPMQTATLYQMSTQLQEEFREKLNASKLSMLPSFHHTLPTGLEIGTILALDVGGSTFRIALIELSGKEGDRHGMDIKRLKSFTIDESVRRLHGTLFFDWMAARIEDVLVADNHESEQKTSGPLPMALAWSFPIEQTSTRTGSLLPMGKGFLATSGCEGMDIHQLVTAACKRRNLDVELQGIVNDASATLLSQAYRDPSTRISLIMGTGINSAVYLPIATLQREKFGQREDGWWDQADHVLVNTELSMFGKSVWDSTRWDDELNLAHPLPDFQPLEYKAGGRFLGELVRLVIVEAVEKGVLFQGRMPQGLDIAYGMDTGLIGVFESDATPTLSVASSAFTLSHPLLNSTLASAADLDCIRQISHLVTSRAAAYVATAVHALWSLQRREASLCPSCSEPTARKEKGSRTTDRATVACNGSIMEKYPTFKSRCQDWLDGLVALSAQGEAVGHVGIEMAVESSVFGAAVAAVAEG